jgi:hypothetical protein
VVPGIEIEELSWTALTCMRLVAIRAQQNKVVSFQLHTEYAGNFIAWFMKDLFASVRVVVCECTLIKFYFRKC